MDPVTAFSGITSNLVLGIILCVMGGMVNAFNEYNRERRKVPPTIDMLGFFTTAMTSCFVGLMGYFAASHWTTSINFVYAFACASCLGGMALVKTLEDIGIEFLRKKLGLNQDDA